MIYEVDILYFDGSCEYLLGMWDNIDMCLADLRYFKEYDCMDQIIVRPKTK